MLTIGEFSKICGVSIKTLHHYDEIDLIKPSYVDKSNGYRYYHLNKTGVMLLINRLKTYGFSLIQVKEIIDQDSPEILGEVLKKQSLILKQKLIDIQQTIYILNEHLEKIEGSDSIMSCQNEYIIKLTERKNTPIISYRQMMGINDFDSAYNKLFELLAEKGLSDFNEVFAIYHDEEFNPEKSDIEVAISIENADKATRILEGGLCVTTIHYGTYVNIPEAYATLLRWIDENGYTYANVPYEIYLKTGMNSETLEEWETLVCFPIVK